VSARQAFEAARVDENYQMRHWGKVDGAFGHNVDVTYAQMRCNSAITYLSLLGDEHSDATLPPRAQLANAGLKVLKAKAKLVPASEAPQ
jgi:hypothetical protein